MSAGSSAYRPRPPHGSGGILLEDGKQVEMAAVGREGMTGLPLALGSNTDGHAAMAQIPGAALRMEATAFRQVLVGMPILQMMLGRYALALLTQTAGPHTSGGSQSISTTMGPASGSVTQQS